MDMRFSVNPCVLKAAGVLKLRTRIFASRNQHNYVLKATGNTEGWLAVDFDLFISNINLRSLFVEACLWKDEFGTCETVSIKIIFYIFCYLLSD